MNLSCNLYGLYYKCMTKSKENRVAAICNAVSVRSEAYSRYAIGDTIRVYATSSGRVVPVSTVEKMRIWHIGSRGLASEHLPELFGLIGGGLVLWRCANRRRS